MSCFFNIQNYAISLCNGINAPTNSSFASLIFSFGSLSSRTFFEQIQTSLCASNYMGLFSSTDDAPSANQLQKVCQRNRSSASIIRLWARILRLYNLPRNICATALVPKVHSLPESRTITPIHNITNTAHKVHCTVQTTHLYLIIVKLTLISPPNHLYLTINSFIICYICPLLAKSRKQSLQYFIIL